MISFDMTSDSDGDEHERLRRARRFGDTKGGKKRRLQVDYGDEEDEYEG